MDTAELGGAYERLIQSARAAKTESASTSDGSWDCTQRPVPISELLTAHHVDEHTQQIADLVTKG